MTAAIVDLTSYQEKRRREADVVYLENILAAPAYMALPFVTMKKNGDGIGYSRAESYWNDVPTDDPYADHARGTTYAKMAITALASDRNFARGLELTFEHMFLDAVRRREARGKYSRSLTPAATAFLHEIAQHINGSVGGYVPPTAC
jgi:hypothetical protein